jgi:hypothetical protein
MVDNVFSRIAVEIAAGGGLSMGKVARRVGVSPATASRWVSQGLPDGLGGRRRLEAIRRGRVYFTSEAALVRFFDGLPNNNTRDPPPSVSLMCTATSTLPREGGAETATQILKKKFNY